MQHILEHAIYLDFDLILKCVIELLYRRRTFDIVAYF